MLDIRFLEEHTNQAKEGFARRGLSAAILESVLALSKARREKIQALQTAQSQRNRASQEIALLMSQGKKEQADVQKENVLALKKQVQELEQEAKQVEAELEDLLVSLPNLPLGDVPEGADEQANVTVHTFGEPKVFSFAPKPHEEIGQALGGMDFLQAAKVSGSRFCFLKGDLARLERALGAFMLDVHTREHGYTEISPPLLVKEHSMFGTAQLPKFRDDQFATQNDLWLIPTAEVSLTNLAADRIIEQRELPLRFCAFTPCFRLEAGAAGRDTTGLIRQHQFHKVELVSIVRVAEGLAEHERMTKCAQSILERLELPYRRQLLCGGDMGFSARKTYDLEVWLPFAKTYREISSCSFCGDFQARRMQARVRMEDGSLAFVGTLNGSALATGRTLVAVLENYQCEDGSIDIPKALWPYMNGQERIQKLER